MNAPLPVFDAVTAVLIHGGEVLLVRRQPHLLAFPGYHAFPGGKVDKTDAAPPASLGAHPTAARIEPRLMAALQRELQEELGFDLDASIRGGDVLALRVLGLAVTPPLGAAARFATNYYSIELRRRPEIALDVRECAEAFWAPPEALVRRYESGEFLMVPPTLMTLRALAQDLGSSEAFHFGHDHHLKAMGLPWIEAIRGVRQIPVRSNTLPPADRTNCFLIGDTDARRVLVDPAPNSEEELARLYAVVDPIGIHEVFLTHHHIDHRERAEAVARRYGVPIGMSADTQARLLARQPALFDGLEVIVRREGDEVARWMGQPVRVIEVPGHDEGQLALMPDNRGWCIVGDLFQGIGTVVIAEPEGDMRKYFASLARIIALKPRVIYPSHGVGMGGTFRLEETLRHRHMREAQVLEMTLAGKTEDEMLQAIYGGSTDPRLMPFARMNIRSHQKKLKLDGALPA